MDDDGWHYRTQSGGGIGGTVSGLLTWGLSGENVVISVPAGVYYNNSLLTSPITNRAVVWYKDSGYLAVSTEASQ